MRVQAGYHTRKRSQTATSGRMNKKDSTANCLRVHIELKYHREMAPVMSLARVSDNRAQIKTSSNMIKRKVHLNKM